jgi:hypothetical protein
VLLNWSGAPITDLSVKVPGVPNGATVKLASGTPIVWDIVTKTATLPLDDVDVMMIT